MKKENKPIFIHSLFRTGSTYIWNKFRQDERYFCYYEPFHQNFSKITVNNVEHLMTKDFGSVNHPSLSNYYLYEYKPLLKSGDSGLPYFRKTYSFDEFCYNEVNTDLKKYLDHLVINTADKVPVLQFNRSALRVKWFKQNYPDSLNIYLVRNPRDQWQSYFEVYKKTNYVVFFVMDLLTASVNKEKEYFKHLSLNLPLFEYHNSSYDKEENFYQVILNSYSEEEKYLIFYYIWFMALIENVLYADFILNINLLSQKPLYRENVTDFLIKHGIEGIDFKDVKITGYPSHQLSPKVMNEIEKKVHYFVLRSIPGDQISCFFEKISTFDRKYFQLNREKFLDLKKKKFREVSQKKIAAKLEKMILSFAEEFFHLKEKNNILQNSLNNQKNLLKQKETQIDQKDKQLDLKDQQLAKKDEQLAQKDVVLKKRLNEKDKQLALEDLQLDKKDEQLAQKDEKLRQKLNEKEKLINEKDQQLAWKDVQLSKKDEQLTHKEREFKQTVNKKDQQLAWKDVQLSKKDEQLAHKEREFKKTVDTKDRQLAWKDVQLSKKDVQLVQKDVALKKKLDEKDKQLAWMDVQLSKKDEQLVQKDEVLKQKVKEKEKLLNDKDQQLTWKVLQLGKKDQQLEEMERQLREKIQQLKMKEENIQKMRNSYTYRTGRILLFPFIKFKRLIKKMRV